MRRSVKIITLAILLFVYSCLAVGCSNAFRKAKKFVYSEYTETEDRIYFRDYQGMFGMHGYIKLGGMKIAAEFSPTVQGNIVVTIAAEDAPEGDFTIDKSHGKPYVVENLLYIKGDINKNNQIVSDEGVELFGENFGQVVLTRNQLTAEDFDAWEYYSRWEKRMSNDWKLVSFGATCSMYSVYKCVKFHVKKDADGKQKTYIFQWLPDEKGFAIYEREEENDHIPNEGQEPIATGIYVLKDVKVTLTFITDNLFDGAYPTLELTIKS